MTVLTLGSSGVAVYFIFPSIPDWVSLSQESDTFDSSTYAIGTFGNKYKNYLVSAKSINKDWWEWAFKRLTASNPLSGKFSVKTGEEKVTSGFQETEKTDSKALNQVCNTAYKTQESEVNGTENNFSKEEIFKYCSPGKILTLSDTNDNYASRETTNKKIGEENKSTLVSISYSENSWFWEKRTEEFYKDSGDNSGSSANSNSLFHSAFEKKNTKTTLEIFVAKLMKN